MDEDTETALLLRCEEELTMLLQPFMGADMNQFAADHVRQAVKDYGIQVRMRGVNFPDIVLVILPKRGWIGVHRADSDNKQIGRIILELAKKFPGIEVVELVLAIGEAFPSYKPEKEFEMMEKNRDRLQSGADAPKDRIQIAKPTGKHH